MAVCLERSGFLTFVNDYPSVELFWNVSKANFQSPSEMWDSLKGQLLENKRGNEEARRKTTLSDFWDTDFPFWSCGTIVNELTFYIYVGDIC